MLNIQEDTFSTHKNRAAALIAGKKPGEKPGGVPFWGIGKGSEAQKTALYQDIRRYTGFKKTFIRLYAK